MMLLKVLAGALNVNRKTEEFSTDQKAAGKAFGV
jgi:hypothetical protein